MASIELKKPITEMLKPLDEVEFSPVVESITGYKVKKFNHEDKNDKILLVNLVKVADLVLEMVNKIGIDSNRANEVGNKIEPFVKEALIKIGYQADTPITQSGIKQSTGYPDISFYDDNERLNYLECKTYNINNLNTSQRSFCLSPSNNPKITELAHHFGISFEIIKENEKFFAKSWKILDLYNLKLKIKYEFNASNRTLYSKDLILAER
ncbi:hypothetical protein [Flavobacterium sp. CS20]|jgi:hypothetical protein|uniref:hypothetical protein n=1 Tax=Flavobacterium sp. CS20 TaxID=2775246 RepID=UPI001B3A126C|nr:hypothetical protein [Flavobacterium sp. CS20]QTY26069.1 hypothetical protein IGB25_08720 [Flavobacterium sp. CS20]